jgi:hypothetical protein
MSIVNMGQKCSAVTPQGCAAASEVASRAPGSGLDIGWREQAPAEQDGHLLGIELIVLGFAAMHGFHRAGMAQAKGQALWRPESGQPVPGQQTLDGHDKPRSLRGNGLEQGCRSGLQVAVQQDCSRVIHEADGQAPRVQSNTTVKWV